MDTVIVVVNEILGFLAIAWILGFFVAWAIFRPIQLDYEKGIEEYEESIDYLKSINRNQEKEIVKLTREVQELKSPKHSTKEFLETQKKKYKKSKSETKQPQIKKKLVKSEDEILQVIEATLEKIK